MADDVDTTESTNVPSRKSGGNRGGKWRPAKNPKLPAATVIMMQTNKTVLRSKGDSITLNTGRLCELCGVSALSMQSEESTRSYLLFGDGSHRSIFLTN